MMSRTHRWALLMLVLCLAHPPWADAADRRNAAGVLPRFASLKSAQTNVRAGPGLGYPIRWIYKRQGLPVEIIAEYGAWRRIRGSDGSVGWVHAVLLSARRTALARPWSRETVDLVARPGARARIIARLQPRVGVRLDDCDRSWCAVEVIGKDLDGYVRQTELWGVYPDEVIGEHSIWRSFERLL